MNAVRYPDFFVVFVFTVPRGYNVRLHVPEEHITIPDLITYLRGRGHDPDLMQRATLYQVYDGQAYKKYTVRRKTTLARGERL